EGCYTDGDCCRGYCHRVMGHRYHRYGYCGSTSRFIPRMETYSGPGIGYYSSGPKLSYLPCLALGESCELNERCCSAFCDNVENTFLLFTICLIWVSALTRTCLEKAVFIGTVSTAIVLTLFVIIYKIGNWRFAANKDTENNKVVFDFDKLLPKKLISEIVFSVLAISRSWFCSAFATSSSPVLTYLCGLIISVNDSTLYVSAFSMLAIAYERPFNSNSNNSDDIYNLIHVWRIVTGLGYWAYERKRRMQDSAISCPLTPDQMNILGLSYRSTTIPAHSYLQPSHHYSSHPNSTHSSVNSSIIHNKY
ncbi:unnamed protein product, partial [Oppiella nova]